MSRLYTVTESDTRRNPATLRGNYQTDTVVYWGSTENSKPLIHVFVAWDRDTEFPIVIVKAKDPNARFCYFVDDKPCWHPEPYEEEVTK